MIVNGFDTTVNFWNVNPQLKAVGPTKELYDADKAKDKEVSSRLMWAIALIYDPASKFFNLPIRERKQIIYEDYLKYSPDDKEIAPIVKFYESLTTTAAKRQLIEWNRKLDEKTEFIASLRYNLDNWKAIEDMLINNTKLYNELARISESLTAEGDSGVTKGGVVESASETGLL